MILYFTYTYSKTNNSIIFRILEQISLIFGINIQILFCQIFENGNRYKAEVFSVNLFFNRLSDDISHFVVC